MSKTAMAKRPKIKKESKPAVAMFLVSFIDNPDNLFPMKVFNYKRCLPRLERYLESVKGKWKYALLKEANTGTVLSYYHPKNGANPLDKEAYTKLTKKNSYSLYIIPTAAYKRKVGNHKGTTQKVSSLDKVASYYNENVLRIDVYQNGSKINSFVNGKFLK